MEWPLETSREVPRQAVNCFKCFYEGHTHGNYTTTLSFLIKEERCAKNAAHNWHHLKYEHEKLSELHLLYLGPNATQYQCWQLLVVCTLLPNYTENHLA